MTTAPEDLAATLRHLVEPLVDKGEPGLAVGVYESGTLLASACAGLAVVEHDVPVTVDTVFDIASVSKQVTAACVLLLARDGRIDLDADIRGYVPDLALAEAVTLRQCLTHTAGLRDLYAICELAGIDERGMREPDALRIIRRLRDLDFAPGSEYSYSNTGYVLAAAAVRAVTGDGLAAYAAAHVFGPLGAAVTRFRDDVGVLVPHLAGGYVSGDGGFRRHDVAEEVVGDGAVITSIADYGAWHRFMATGDVLGIDIRDALCARPLLADGSRSRYALGLEHLPMPGDETAWTHSGSWAGYRSDVVYLPVRDRSVAVFANRDDRWPWLLGPAVARGLATGEDPAAVLGEYRGRPAAADVAAAARDLAVGLWHEPAQDHYLWLYAADDGLLGVDDDERYRFAEDGRWYGEGVLAGDTYAIDGDSLLAAGAVSGEEYGHYRRAAAPPEDAVLPIGFYRSAELDVPVTVSDAGITVGAAPVRALRPAGAGVWRGASVTVRHDGEDLLVSVPGARRIRLTPALTPAEPAIGVATVSPAVASPAATGSPVGTRLDARRLGRLDEVLERYVARDDVAGVVAVVDRGGETHVAAVGALSREAGAAHVGADTVFRISSMTKPVVAVAAMTLVEECRLQLDEPIDRWMPELADRHVLRRLDAPLDDVESARRPITVRDLLTFRMGFGQIIAAPDAYPILAVAHAAHIGMGPPDPDAMPGPDEWLRRLGSLPLMFQPGERWMYHTSADVLGVLVARVVGQPLGVVLRDRIFAPLGMRDTGFSVPPASMPRFATAYTADGSNGHLLYDVAASGAWSREPAFPSGGGGLVSTALDYLEFARMMRRGGGPVLSPASVSMMTADHLTDAQKAVSGLLPESFTAAGWGFGVGVTTAREQLAGSVGAYGWDGGLGSVWRNDPSSDASLLLFTQQMWASPRFPPLVRDFFTLSYASFASHRP